MRIRDSFAVVVVAGFLLPLVGPAQDTGVPPREDLRMYDVLSDVSPDNIEASIRTLVGFGTRNTLSETESETRGIGAARRWIKARFDLISVACDGCLEVSFVSGIRESDSNARLERDVDVVNVVAVQRGTRYRDRYVIMSGDIDSRASNSFDAVTDAPGANDNATGIAGTLEAARVLSQYEFPTSVMYLALSGEEQGLWGGTDIAEIASNEGWDIVGILNNDMIGNIEGVDGVIANDTFRVFSEPTPLLIETETDRRRRRSIGGEVDGISRQLARYVDRLTDQYVANLDAIMIYRLDRFNRGGHHRPFNDAGFAGVRIMETHENYTRQHQDVRIEDGIQYGDLIEGVDFDYAARLTGVNAITMAALAWAPPQPSMVTIGGGVRPSAYLTWSAVEDPDRVGYRVYWRDTTAPQWEHSRFVGNVTEYLAEGLVVDNFLFGVASVGRDGNESVVVFPSGTGPAGP